MPSMKMKKEAIHSVLERSPRVARHYPGLQKMAKRARGCMAGIAHDDVVENFDFEKLARSNEVASDLDVRFGRRGVAARMVVRNDDGSGACHNG